MPFINHAFVQKLQQWLPVAEGCEHWDQSMDAVFAQHTRQITESSDKNDASELYTFQSISLGNTADNCGAKTLSQEHNPLWWHTGNIDRPLDECRAIFDQAALTGDAGGVAETAIIDSQYVIR